MAEIAFTKYQTKKGYHWRDYVRGGKYRKHCDFIKKWVTEKNILDVGAGDGIITFLLGAKGIDNEQAAVDIAEAVGVDVSLGDAYNLSFADNIFDAVTMIDVLEHFGEPERALQEARRVAPILYIATPERQPDNRVRDKFHVQEWTRNELVFFMKDNGYKLADKMHFADKGATMYAKFVRN